MRHNNEQKIKPEQDSKVKNTLIAALNRKTKKNTKFV